MKVLFGPGTHAWRGVAKEYGRWYASDSPFSAYLTARGIAIDGHGNGEPFRWSSDVGGLNPFSSHDDLVWDAAGWNLLAHCRCRKLEPVNIISHSHFIQVVIHAMSHGLTVNRLVDIAGPVRKRQRALAEQAIADGRITGAWVHLRPGKDPIRRLGEFFDGQVRTSLPPAVIVNVKEANHGDIVRTPKYFQLVPLNLGLGADSSED